VFLTTQILSTSLLVITFCSAFGKTDSTKMKYNASEIFYTTENEIDKGKTALYSLDTTINNLHDFNPIYQQQFDYKFLGNIGTAHKSLFFDPYKRTGFDLGYHQFDLYKYDKDDIRYFRAKNRYSEMSYAAGGKTEQMFTIMHTQNINKNLNFGVKYRRLVSDGFYFSQKTDYKNLKAFVWYRSLNKRYNLIANGTLNYFSVQENGGMMTTDIFKNPSFDIREIEEVNLSGASTSTKHKGFYVKQYWDLGKKYKKQLNDTTTIQRFAPSSRLSHSIEINRGYQLYEDEFADSSYYASTYLPVLTDQPMDSIYHRKIVNSISWSTLPNYRNDSLRQGLFEKSIISVGVSHSLHYLFLPFKVENSGLISAVNFSNDFQNVSIQGSYENFKSKTFRWFLGGQYIVEGFNLGDYKAKAEITKPVNKSYFKIGGLKQLKSPTLVQIRHMNNFLDWKNTLDKTDITQLYFNWTNKKINAVLGVKYNLIDNYIYFDKTARIGQKDGVANLLQAYATKNFTFGKFRFNNIGVFQQSSSSTVIVPQWWSRHSFYYENYLFKKAILVQIGTTIRYNTLYYGDTYMPATGQFYMQDVLRIGNYPVADVFLNAKIKSARMFIKMENVNQGFPEDGYFQVANYPIPDRKLKVGLFWKFFD